MTTNIICPVCGLEFDISETSGSGFCSGPCYQKDYKRRRKDAVVKDPSPKKPKYKRVPTIVIHCSECGKELVTGRGYQKTCGSSKCRSQRSRRIELERREGERQGILRDLRKKDQPMVPKDLAELREKFCIPDKKVGVVLCLRCGRRFKSWDVKGNRVCPRCATSNSYEENWEDGAGTYYVEYVTGHDVVG